MGLDGARVQFTPDLMPADILGSEVLETGADGSARVQVHRGAGVLPVADGRRDQPRPPRTQSALLQAMQEKSVTIAGQPHALPEPFHVLATQNPIEQEGTYPLPEAQLDRFLVQIDVDYPDRDTERDILLATTGTERCAVDAGVHGRGTDGRADAGAPDAGRRRGGGTDPRSGARLPPGRARRARDRQPDRRLGSRPARRAGADADGAGAGACWTGAWRPSPRMCWRWRAPVLSHRMALTFAARARGESLCGRDRQRGRAGDPGRGRRVTDTRRPSPTRRGPCRPAAAAAGRGRASGAGGAAGRAWAPAGGHGRRVLAIPPGAGRRRGADDRLAPLGAGRTRISCAKRNGRRRSRC